MTDSWEAVKRRFVAVVGHERQLDAARAELATRHGPDRAEAQAELARAWVTRLRDVLEDQPGVAPDLRALVASLGSVPEPTVTQRADRGSVNVSGGNRGEIYVGVGKVDKRRFRFSPLLFFGHAAKAHPFVASAVTVVTIGGVAGGVVAAHGIAAHAAIPPPAVSSSAPVLPHAATGWAQPGFGPSRTSDQPDETQIGTGNVARLTQARTYRTAADPSAPLVANGILYVDANRLYAFDATAAPGCSAAPATCTPLWTAATAGFGGMTVADGDVFVADAEGVQAFSAAGSENCSGTPKFCDPLWATSRNLSTGPGFTPGQGASPVVANGVLYVPGYGDGMVPSEGGALVAAFDPAGRTGCSRTPVICVPMWTTTGLPASTGNTGSPAVANGVLYIANGTLDAFDATGSTGCSGTPKVCAPLWTAPMPGSGATSSAPAVAGGVVYVGTFYSGLYAFDAAGSANCSGTATGKTCAPLWNARTPSTIEGTPAVAGGVVYVDTTGTLAALAAGGAANCPGTGTVRTCTRAPLWTSAPGALVSGSPTVANGVVYVSASGGGAYGYDASGKLRCSVSSTAKACSPLWSSPVTGFSGDGQPAIAGGSLFVTVGGGMTYAYSL
jgi:hypothetical protein